jgi:hypothetical protein
MARALLSQDRKVGQFKVGRRDSAYTHASALTITADTGTIAVTISKAGVSRTYTQTGGGGGIPAEATALAAAINADASGWGTSGDGTLTVAAAVNDVTIDAVSPANDGVLWYYSDLSNIDYDDETPDPGLAADLLALRAEDDDWYAVTLDSCSGAEGAGLAAALSTDEKLVLVACQDSDCAAGSGLVGTFESQAYARAGAIYKLGPMSEYVACAALGYSLPYPPGSLDWMFKTYQGITADDHTANTISTLKAAYGNMYVQVVRDSGIFQEAVVGSGAYIDIVHLKDYLTFRIREAAWNLLRSGPKIPYTDKGARAMGGAIENVLKSAQRNAINAGGDALVLVDDEGRNTFQFDFTPAAEQETADRNARIFRGLTWQATLASSIRQVFITGELV